MAQLTHLKRCIGQRVIFGFDGHKVPPEMNLLDEQRHMFRAGANGLMIGDYLTTEGVTMQTDYELLKDLGMQIRPPPHAPHPPSVPPEVRAEGTDMAGLTGKTFS